MAAIKAAADIKPGSPLAAVFMTGDISLTGTGTCTWRDGNRVLAFGHPMFGFGASQLPMAGAQVVSTVPSFESPYKLTNTGPVHRHHPAGPHLGHRGRARPGPAAGELHHRAHPRGRAPARPEGHLRAAPVADADADRHGDGERAEPLAGQIPRPLGAHDRHADFRGPRPAQARRHLQRRGQHAARLARHHARPAGEAFRPDQRASRGQEPPRLLRHEGTDGGPGRSSRSTPIRARFRPTAPSASRSISARNTAPARPRPSPSRCRKT